jgi:hypothetical protein
VSQQAFIFPEYWKGAAERIVREAVEDLIRKASQATAEGREGKVFLTLMLDSGPRDWKIGEDLSRPRTK